MHTVSRKINDFRSSRKKATYTTADMDPILAKMAKSMKHTQTKDMKDILASRATFLYRQRGITTSRVARKMTNSRLTKKLWLSRPVTLMRTLVTVSPTTTLYDTIAVTINKSFKKFLLSLTLQMYNINFVARNHEIF